MKGFTTIALAIMVGGMLLVASPTSRATDDVIDCSNGCLIMTCDGLGICTIWECNASGCQVVGTFQRLARSTQKNVSSVEGSEQATPTSGAKVCEFERETCAIKVCERGECEVSVFDGRAFVPAAVIGDINDIVDRAQRKLGEESRER